MSELMWQGFVVLAMLCSGFGLLAILLSELKSSVKEAGAYAERTAQEAQAAKAIAAGMRQEIRAEISALAAKFEPQRSETGCELVADSPLISAIRYAMSDPHDEPPVLEPEGARLRDYAREVKSGAGCSTLHARTAKK